MGKLLFLPMQTENQFRMCNSIAQKIIEMYGDEHEIYVAVGKDWEDKLKKMCPQLKIATFRHPNDQLQKEWIARTGKNKSEILAKLCEEYVQIWNNPKKTDMVDTMANFYENFLSHICKIYPFVTKIVQDLKPNFIIQNFQLSTPLGIDQGIPYALLQSCSPTFFGHELMPPPMSDLPSEPTIENRKLWSDFFDQAHLLRHCDLKVKFNNWLKAHRVPNLDERMFYLVESPYLNIQLYPEALDYDVELPGKWCKLQSAVCQSAIPSPLEIPNKLKNLNGKIIYINLGYNQLIYSFVFNKLLTILPHVNHRFIISMNLNNDEIAPNMYADSEIDPLSAIQVADLIIYHAGTKLMCDSFHFGVPGVVISLYGDQIDNGRRLEDKNLGVRLYPNELTQKSLEDAINRCLDPVLQNKFKEISMRNKADNGLENLCNEIVKYLNK